MLRHLFRERFSAPTVALLLLLAAVPMAAEAQQAGAAVDSGLREKVDVPFVLLDVTVVDRRGRTIHDLDREAFELIFDRRPVPIETLDVDCPAGATADAAPGEPRPPWRLADSAAGIRPRIVLAFDYFHMRPAVDALDQAERLVRERFLGDAEHMVVAVAEGLRIESPWTRDRELLLETFQRMRDDEELYFGAYDHLTERRVFRRFQMLVDLLEPLPGRKIIVLFTGPMDRGGFDYDPQYGELASSSGRARTAFYPVDVAGMVFGRPAWPASLARLASSTGGRLTSNTNDLTLGYARARRDLGCTYTLGFRPPPERAAEGADLQVEVRRDGARALHASRFRRREADETERALVEVAAMAPELFPAGALQVHAHPESGRSGVTIRTELPEGAEPWSLQLLVRSGRGTVLHERRRGTDADQATASVWAPRVELRPGRYRVAVAARRSGMELPWAREIELELPRRSAD